VLGLRSGRATILPGLDSSGQSYFSDDGGLRSVKAILAGRAATELLLDCASDHGCSVDDAKAMALIRALGFRDPDSARTALLDDTRELIRKHAGTVALLALRLLAAGELSGAEIDELMRR
jgi:hypothetical protein